ncbi:hypothetical protein MWU49_02475 [Alcanivorax sp. S6407]|uniref:hypothetical protein n=1 Tax=Alcanivorax sp. S6407 TaxID=2926424 RepID=UPI001FF51EE3|nr:hypothetical protein [Alcanivorax sp. S6407]MCK0152557.1 hypothetical protein [Alcanivorax sp. S6407]
MKKNNRSPRTPLPNLFRRGLLVSLAGLVLFVSGICHAMVELKDDQLSNVTGQALMQMNKIVGDVANGNDGFTFYTAGLDVMLDLNLNIEKLQLGCGGVNGVGCDLDIDHFSLGCIANAAGNCISLNPQAGSNQISGAVADNIANQNQMKDFSIQRPFFQFAIKNDQSKTLREVVGIRMGGEKVSGPLSFGSLNSFSGRMSGQLNLAMRGANNVAVTCAYGDRPCIAPGADPSGMIHQGASSWGSPGYPSGCGAWYDPCDRGGMGTPSGGYLNLGDDMILDIGIADIRFQEALVNYQDVIRNGNAVELSGNRESQAQVSGVNLAGVINSIVYGNNDGTTAVGSNPLTLADTDAGALVSVFGPTLLPLLRGGIADQIKRQLAQGLRIYNADAATNQSLINSKEPEEIHTDLNNYQLPYNVTNVHQVDVTSDDFGLSFQKEAVRYPGYTTAMLTGWSMYSPDAFTLNIDQATTTLMANILGSSAARDGNIIGLEPAYRNCWGSARFC